MEPSRGTGGAEHPVRPGHLFWIPPFLLGAAAAAAAELCAGLLLYSTEGLLRALTVVLATEAAALGVGLASSAHLGSADLAPVRRRWMLALIAFAGAAAFSAAWGLGEGFSAAPVSQGLGLALLGGLPLYASGAVFGALAAPGPSESAAGTGTGAAAAFGAGAGVLLTGVFAVPDLEPTSVYLFCVVAVSVGALVHGWLLDRRVLVRILAGLPPGDRGGPVRLEERFRPAAEDDVVRLIRVRDRVADAAGEGNRIVLPWQRGVVELLRRRSDRIGSALLVGVGLEAFSAGLRSALGPEKVAAEEPWKEIRDLVEAGAPAGRRAEEGADVPGEVDRSRSEDDRFDAVVVNLRLLPGASVLGPALPILERAARRRTADGVLALGGLELGGRAADHAGGLAGWISGRRWAPAVTILRPTDEGEAAAGLLGDAPDRGGGLVLAGSSNLGTGLLEIPGMQPVPTVGETAADPGAAGRSSEER